MCVARVCLWLVLFHDYTLLWGNKTIICFLHYKIDFTDLILDTSKVDTEEIIQLENIEDEEQIGNGLEAESTINAWLFFHLKCNMLRLLNL